jgi:hypothetical protein
MALNGFCTVKTAWWADSRMTLTHFNWWQQVLILIVLDGAWNSLLAHLRTEKRSLKILKWLDKRLAGKKGHDPAMATACLFYGLISIYGMFGAARFLFRMRRQIKQGANKHVRRNNSNFRSSAKS